MNNLISSLENREMVVGALFDFSNDFDTIDHVISLSK